MVIDTTIVIEYIRSRNKSATTFHNLKSKQEIFISAVSVYELYIGASTIYKEDNIELITRNLVVLPFTYEVSLKAAIVFHQLKAKNKLIEFRDIFIAATCLVNNLPISTLNKKHFERIEGLEIA